MKKYSLLALSFVLISFFSLKGQEDKIFFESDPENLGSIINSSCDETDTRVAPDGQTLYFIRWKCESNIGGADARPDIYYSKLGADGKWQEGINIGEPINDEEFNMVVGMRPDGNAMILNAKYNEELNTKLYIVYRKGGKWQEPEPMLFDSVDYKIRFRGLTISPDFKTLIFADSEKGKDGKPDLFISFMQKNDKWSKPLYMGTTLNTDLRDEWPVLANDAVTLYYTSSGLEGFGSGDIYMTRRLDTTWLNWSKPINLGDKINTSGYDADFVVDTEGKYAYLSSNKTENSDFDIFRIALPESARPEPVVLIKGKVYNKKTNEPLEVDVQYFNLTSGEELGKSYADAKEGYKIVLPYGEKYSFNASLKGFAAISENLNLTSENKELTDSIQYQEITKDLYLVPIEVGSVVRINNLFFATAKADLNKDSELELKNVLQFLTKNPTVKIEIQGHTDNVGNDAYNLDLSKRRANTVYNYLIEKGVDKTRIAYKGYGEANPIATNSTDAGKQKNRRVEFKITGK